MIDFRPVAQVLGWLLSVLAVAMLIPALVDLILGYGGWRIFVASATLTLFVGVALALTSRSRAFELRPRQAFILTVLLWVAIAAFAALPFRFSNLGMGYTDAFFESMSGITTTGATVITGLDDAPPGILMWRALLQWLGGIGIIVMAISILPMLQVGGMQLFRTEGSDTSEKVLPRATQIASSLGLIYLALTLVCAAAYASAGMSLFDAIAHAMTTVATGGFSTRDLSIGAFGSGTIDLLATLFMILGALPFVLYLQVVRGRGLDLVRDSQVHWFLAILASAILGMILYLEVRFPDLGSAAILRLASFNVVSIMTGTGYATSDFGIWGPFAVSVFFFLMFIGGCAGSTTCGIKVFRFQILYATFRNQLSRLIYPHGVTIAYYNGKPIPETVAESVMGFFFMFVICFGLLTMALGMVGLDFITAVSGAASAMANVGPGLGPIIGPSGTYQSLDAEAKWLLSFGMLLGRLELFTVLVLLSPQFWRS